MHRQDLLQRLTSHRTDFPDEATFTRRARDFVAGHADCFHRELMPRHVTASTWVVNPARDHALLLHHGKHNRWFQPGGHADGDPDVLAVALREVQEESGLHPDAIRLVDDWVFDVDIHTIPDDPHAPPHEHIDVRFLVEVDDTLPVPGNEESHEVRWVPLEAISRYNNTRSMWRMVEKTRRLRRRPV